jgi:DNA-binding MarR family transcriptional regulator
MIVPLMPPDARIGLLLRLAHRRAARAFSDGLRPLGIEGRHFGVLLTLAGQGAQSQRQLIDRLGSDKSTMVRTVDDLERLDLVIRNPAQGDRRAHAVELTTQGHKVLNEATQIAATVAATLLEPFAPAERKTLADLLERFIERPT